MQIPIWVLIFAGVIFFLILLPMTIGAHSENKSDKEQLKYRLEKNIELEKQIESLNHQILKKTEQFEKEKNIISERTKKSDEFLKRIRKILISNPENTLPDDADFHMVLDQLHLRLRIIEKSFSNLTAIPYMAEIMADYSTHELDILAMRLKWGKSIEREKKVRSLIELRKETKALLEECNVARYQLAYLLELYPVLKDVLDSEFSEIPKISSDELSNTEYDRTKDWLSKEEYKQLSTTERNQLALDRYITSHKKSKWQIGRDYELYVGYKYSESGYAVDTYGSYMGLNDLGRDLICKKGGATLIVQCKYWSDQKTIHEKHITQLYGTVVEYCIEEGKDPKTVQGVLITNISLSETAKKFADFLGIKYKEHVDLGDFPRIKCNIGRDEYGNPTKIYHLPFDQQYDATIIDAPGEFYAMTVKEAENKGFRRAYKWHTNE